MPTEHASESDLTVRGHSNLRWHVKHISSSTSHLPTLPGLYVIGHCNMYYGLELSREYVYVGKTANLRRRLREHQPSSEQNPGLRDYLRRLLPHARCWYAVVDRLGLDEAESDLIRELNPLYNRLGKQETDTTQILA